ncbi:sensor domain-containing diguanylate cyclase [Bowmanella denitrificans]|uniref:sensor domain-containing diguanylate cyclase n=1 Tax=Bowmanella denitrificans TaxID=366582 RepID=UPI000C9CC753|nr:sensor domain-containing diguanylate cyclase [Bowmanella denitrificans]
MNRIESLQKVLFITFLLAVAAISLVAYFAISNIVTEQSRHQQRTMLPVFSLIEEELLKPIHIAQALAGAEIFLPYMQEDADEQTLMMKLTRLEQQFDLVFFIASEKAKRQYHSNGEIRRLDSGDVQWYQRMKDDPDDLTLALGKREDVHLYVDIRQYDSSGQFLGFIGVGKPLDDFLHVFERYRLEHGYDFVFVNARNEILLTSLIQLSPSNQALLTLEDLDWYPHWQNNPTQHGSHSFLVNSAEQDTLITEIPIAAMNWRVFIIAPLEDRKHAMGKTFVINMLLLVCCLLILYWLTALLSKKFQRNVYQRINTDSLTGLSNRAHIDSVFQLFKEKQLPLSLVLADIDHFKSVNDTYGHNLGDQVIRAVAEQLSHGVREGDYVGRWGGEEFVLLLPGASLTSAEQIAERIRLAVASVAIPTDDGALSVTISLGVTQADKYHALVDLIHNADKALYQAKNDGRNKVVSFSTQ